MNLIFGLSDTWDMRKETHFGVFYLSSLRPLHLQLTLPCGNALPDGPQKIFFFEIVIFILFIDIFSFFFLLCNTWKCVFSGKVFHIGKWYLGWENLIILLENIYFWNFLNIDFFTVKGVVFLFHIFLNITLAFYMWQSVVAIFAISLG